MKITPFIFPLFILLFIGYGCKDDEMLGDDEMPIICDDATNPDCPNYDPCLTYGAANADFSILDSLSAGPIDYPGFTVPVDTTWNNDRLFFRAKHENATYEWLVGADPTIHTGKEFGLNFGSAALGDISVRLITTIEDVEGCYSEEERIDTSYKTVHFIDIEAIAEETTSIYGDYYGYVDDKPEDYFTISYKSIYEEPGHGLRNFPKDCELRLSPRPAFRYFLFDTGNDIECDNPKGFAELQADSKTLIIKFTTRVFNFDTSMYEETSEEKTFIGIRQ
ncbi:MAG: hypothetical protein ACI85O_000305 [Saprospiraceae bacterium]|jgi:hypothetical protein